VVEYIHNSPHPTPFPLPCVVSVESILLLDTCQGGCSANIFAIDISAIEVVAVDVLSVDAVIVKGTAKKVVDTLEVLRYS
jgi:hypothetical protein